MELNDDQKQKVAAWVAEGLKLSDIQKRLETEFGLRITYMELRFLVSDLKVIPKDPPPSAPPPVVDLAKKDGGLGQKPAPPAAAPEEVDDEAEALPPGSGGVKLTVDQITRPGAVVSGSVTFTDGQAGTWYLDEMGRLGLGMKTKGYRPPAADVEEFQIKLQQALSQQGF